MSAKEATAKQEQQDMVVEAQDAEGGRDRSTIGFPYQDLDEAVTVAKGVHEVGGQTCQWDQLAAHFQQAATGGAFRMRVLTAKLFGLLGYDRGTVTLTPLGMRICDPQQEASARVDAFLTIPLYKAIYDQFKGATLPSTSGLETAIGNLGVAPKQKGKARQVFQRSAQEAGFFWSGPDRLVPPSIKAGTAAPAVITEEEPEEHEEKEKKPKEKPRHPLVEGLLRELPEPQSEWTTEDRKKWLEMASTIFNVIYKDSDDSRGSLKVVVEKNSAK